MQSHITEVKNSEEVDNLEKLSELDNLKIIINEGLEEALKELDSLHEQFSKEDSVKLLDLCKDSVIDSITSQFGLASLFIDTKDGGNVTTVNNFEKGITANEIDKQRSDGYRNQNYQATRKKKYNPVHNEQRVKYQSNNGIVTDEYTGRKISFKEANLDHIVPIKEIESNAKAHLAKTVEERAKIACSNQNYAITSETANKSKGAKPMKKFVKTHKAEELGIDKNVAMQKDTEARKYIYKENINPALIKKYRNELLATGGKDAAKMMAYSALGIILRELTQTIFDEIRITFQERGKKTLKEIFLCFKERIEIAVKNIRLKWKDILQGSFEAGLTAFLSNIVVFIINLFATTLKKIVSMIRAGFVSFCQAVKILANPPKNMDREEVNYQALKIVMAGLIGAGSLGLSAGIEKLLQGIPGLQPLMLSPIPLPNGTQTVSDILSVILSGLAGGLVTAITFYFMDKCRYAQKKDKLQIQLVNQSGVVVQYGITQTWVDVYEARQEFCEIVKEGHTMIRNTKDEIIKSSGNAEKAINNFSNVTYDALNELDKLVAKTEGK